MKPPIALRTISNPNPVFAALGKCILSLILQKMFCHVCLKNSGVPKLFVTTFFFWFCV